MVNFTQSSNEAFYQVNIIQNNNIKINLQNFSLVAYSYQGVPCGIAKYENLNTKMGYQIAVQGRDAVILDTQSYPYYLPESVLNDLPENILNQIKPKFSLLNNNTQTTIELIGNIPNFETYTLLETNLTIGDIHNG